MFWFDFFDEWKKNLNNVYELRNSNFEIMLFAEIIYNEFFEIICDEYNAMLKIILKMISCANENQFK